MTDPSPPPPEKPPLPEEPARDEQASRRTPPTRWSRVGDSLDTGYATTFTAALDAGEDVDGEARLADALLGRGARVLDAGAGLGRVAGALARRGHDVTAVEPDAQLVAASRARFPEVPVVAADLLETTPQLLETHGRPAAYDLVVLVGNVMVYLADDTEVRALRGVRDLLADDGRVLVGFHPASGFPHARDYPWAEFAEHVAAAGLAVQHRFGSYELHPASDDYVVAVLTRG